MARSDFAWHAQISRPPIGPDTTTLHLDRFISEDPIGFDGGDCNLYRYVWNSSTNFFNPVGEVGVGVSVGGGHRGRPCSRWSGIQGSVGFGGFVDGNNGTLSGAANESKRASERSSRPDMSITLIPAAPTPPSSSQPSPWSLGKMLPIWMSESADMSFTFLLSRMFVQRGS
jgi:hypothetical protein